MASIESPEEGWSDDEETPEKGACSYENQTYQFSSTGENRSVSQDRK
jgi:hypothetical protein